jgi:lipoate-protein ligase A
MARALRIPEGALRGRVTSLAEILPEPPALRDVCASIVWELSKALQRAPVQDEPSREEIALADRLLDEEIGSEDFVMGGDMPLPVKGAA